MPSSPTIRAEALLRNIALFHELSDADIARLAPETRQVRAPRGQILFHRGDPANGFHFLVYGQVKLAFVSPRGNEKVVEIIQPGQSFGEAVMFMERAHVVTAQALADSLLLYINKEVVFAELERDPKLARRMIGGLSMRLHHLITDLESYSMRSGTERVIGFLLDECGAAPQHSGPLEVSLPTAKGVIASRLNLTQEHFSRILHELTAAGLIEVNGRSITIHDGPRLRAFEAA